MNEIPLPQRRSRSASFWIALILFVLFAVSALVNLVLMAAVGAFMAGGASATGHPKAPFAESVISGRGPDKIAVLELQGVITSQAGGWMRPFSMVDQLTQELRQAAADPAIKAVVLDVDSPGGGVTASDELHHQVEALRKTGKPVVVHMGDVCASGGYYVSAGADLIIASPTSITGSIGVIMETADLHHLAVDKLGIDMNVIKSGPFKDIGSPMRAMTGPERDLLQHLVDSMYGRFVDIVASGRSGHGPLSKEVAAATLQVRALADGRVYSSTEAVANGLVDRIGYLDDAITAAEGLAKLSGATVVRYHRHQGLLDLLKGQAMGGEAAAASLDRLSHLDASSLLRRFDPRLEYLWTLGG